MLIWQKKRKDSVKRDDNQPNKPTYTFGASNHIYNSTSYEHLTREKVAMNTNSPSKTKFPNNGVYDEIETRMSPNSPAVIGETVVTVHKEFTKSYPLLNMEENGESLPLLKEHENSNNSETPSYQDIIPSKIKERKRGAQEREDSIEGNPSVHSVARVYKKEDASRSSVQSNVRLLSSPSKKDRLTTLESPTLSKTTLSYGAAEDNELEKLVAHHQSLSAASNHLDTPGSESLYNSMGGDHPMEISAQRKRAIFGKTLHTDASMTFVDDEYASSDEELKFLMRNESSSMYTSETDLKRSSRRTAVLSKPLILTHNNHEKAEMEDADVSGNVRGMSGDINDKPQNGNRPQVGDAEVSEGGNSVMEEEKFGRQSEDTEKTKVNLALQETIAEIDEQGSVSENQHDTHSIDEDGKPHMDSRSIGTIEEADEPSGDDLPPKPKWHPPWQLRQELVAHNDAIPVLVIDPTNRWFATGSNDNTIRLWDIEMYRQKLLIRAHKQSIRAMTFGASIHRYLYSAGDDRQLLCHDIEVNRVISRYKGQSSVIYSICSYQPSNILVTGTRDKLIRIYDTRTSKCVKQLKGHFNTVSCVVTPQTAGQIVSGSHDGTVRLWDLGEGRCTEVLHGHSKSIRTMCEHPDGRTILSASSERILAWELPAGLVIQEIPAKEIAINSITINRLGVTVAGGSNGVMHLWDFKSGFRFQKIHRTKVYESQELPICVFATKFDHTGTKLVCSGACNVVKVYQEAFTRFRPSYLDSGMNRSTLSLADDIRTPELAYSER